MKLPVVHMPFAISPTEVESANAKPILNQVETIAKPAQLQTMTKMSAAWSSSSLGNVNLERFGPGKGGLHLDEDHCRTPWTTNVPLLLICVSAPRRIS